MALLAGWRLASSKITVPLEFELALLSVVVPEQLVGLRPCSVAQRELVTRQVAREVLTFAQVLVASPVSAVAGLAPQLGQSYLVASERHNYRVESAVPCAPKVD
jgi:hypothetical protein